MTMMILGEDWMRHGRPPGADRLEDWDLDLKGLLKGARWAQKRSGYDMDYWTPQKAADAFKSDDPPIMGYLFSLPVCPLDLVSDPPKWVSGVSRFDNLETIYYRQKLSRCARLKIDGTKWPYGYT
ncbi:hypothetical protein N7492_001435 [Penicillium capsulatum]|uniref:Uncharacterized protein n=1 Tax=Penicillium capsulatum TaxID=69766 RepID=A0A9W9M0B2_9EURO|nr:hypothetical protein N7492_001435 [Penicillium capsulatum]